MKHLLQHHWVFTISLLAILAISGCGGQKSDNAGGGNTTSTTAASPAETSSSSTGTGTTKGTVPADAQKLGVTPTGTTCPKDAPVKGLVTAKRGNIYQTTKAPDYAKAKPKICFKDVATAEKAGFKAPTAK